MSMRVLLFTNVYPSRQNPANGMWLVEQVRSLRQRGLQFDVLHINPKDTRLVYLVGLRRLILRLRQDDYDVIHTHDVYTFFLAYLARMLTAACPPVVLTIHEQDLLRARRGIKEHNSFLTLICSPLALLRRSIAPARLAAAKADFVIPVLGDLLEILSPPGPAEVIPCGVDMDKFKPLDRKDCRRQLGISSDYVVVFHPADASVKRKRLNLTREAWRSLKTRLPCTSTLIVGGNIPHDQMPLYYNAADVVLQTSLLEASPTIIKEALACEVPIVSTDCGDTRDMLRGVAHCYVCDGDPRVLGDHLLAALGHRAIGGRERVREKSLALDQVADRMIGVYTRVLLNEDHVSSGGDLIRKSL